MRRLVVLRVARAVLWVGEGLCLLCVGCGDGVSLVGPGRGGSGLTNVLLVPCL